MTCPKCGHENLAGARYCSQCAALLPRSSRSDGGGGKVLGCTAGIVLLGVAAAAGMLMFAFGSGTVEGQIRSQGKPYGTWTLQPAACYSGQHESFFGVWVAPKLQKAGGREGFKGGLKLMKTPLDEWNAYVESPLECESFKCKMWEVPRTSCKVFDVEVRKTSSNVNEIWVVEGHARLDCTTPEGGTLTASLKFDGCH